MPPASAGPLPGQGLPVSDPMPYPLLVQVENTAPSRPQAGIQPASLVFQYLTESDITRFSVIYHRVPGVVGPVRSARFITQYLYRRFDAVMLASGAGNATLGRVWGEQGMIGGFFNDFDPRWFFRWGGRPAPHNVYSRQDQLVAVSRLGLRPPMAGDVFRSDKWSGTEPAGQIVVPLLRASFEFGAGTYSVNTDGAPQEDAIFGPIRAHSVVVMHVPQSTTCQIHDVNGVCGRDFDLNSGGAAEMYANGTVIRGRWQSPGERQPLRFVDAAGGPVGLPTGLSWVLLAE
ncbi:MAG: DUF3048 domain-containing protein [Candidatus Dormibacteria bacterium]